MHGIIFLVFMWPVRQNPDILKSGYPFKVMHLFIQVAAFVAGLMKFVFVQPARVCMHNTAKILCLHSDKSVCQAKKHTCTHDDVRHLAGIIFLSSLA